MLGKSLKYKTFFFALIWCHLFFQKGVIGNPFFDTNFLTEQEHPVSPYFYGRGDMGLGYSLATEMKQYWDDFQVQDSSIKDFRYPSFLVNGKMAYYSASFAMEMEYLYRQLKKTKSENLEERQKLSAFMWNSQWQNMIYHNLVSGIQLAVHHKGSHNAVGDKSIFLDQINQITNLPDQPAQWESEVGASIYTGLKWELKYLITQVKIGYTHVNRQIQQETDQYALWELKMIAPLYGIFFCYPFHFNAYFHYYKNFMEENIGGGLSTRLFNDLRLDIFISERRYFFKGDFFILPFWSVYFQVIQNRDFAEKLFSMGMSFSFGGFGFPYPFEERPGGNP